MKRVLVLGTDNACISQMMAALLKHITFDRIEVASAGVTPKKIDKTLIKVLQEIGIDLSKEKSKTFNEFVHNRFEIIISTSEESRPLVDHFVGSVTKIHKEFEDPRHFKGSPLEKANEFRRLRDDMNEWLSDFVSRHRLV
ncbi:MAG: arsenate reductase ArsC [Calditrichaceae bacterium]